MSVENAVVTFNLPEKKERKKVLTLFVQEFIFSLGKKNKANKTKKNQNKSVWKLQPCSIGDFFESIRWVVQHESYSPFVKTINQSEPWCPC